MRVHAGQYIPNPRICLKTLKKLDFLNYGQRSRVLHIDYISMPVAQLFLTVSQLKNYFGRSIKILQWEGLREERKERITVLRLSPDQVWISLWFKHFPKFRKPLFPWVLISFHLWEISFCWLWKEPFEDWDWTNLEDGSAWSRKRQTQVNSFYVFIIVICNERNTVLWYQLFSCIWCYCYRLCVNDYFNV